LEQCQSQQISLHFYDIRVQELEVPFRSFIKQFVTKYVIFTSNGKASDS